MKRNSLIIARGNEAYFILNEIPPDGRIVKDMPEFMLGKFFGNGSTLRLISSDRAQMTIPNRMENDQIPITRLNEFYYEVRFEDLERSIAPVAKAIITKIFADILGHEISDDQDGGHKYIKPTGIYEGVSKSGNGESTEILIDFDSRVLQVNGQWMPFHELKDDLPWFSVIDTIFATIKDQTMRRLTAAFMEGVCRIGRMSKTIGVNREHLAESFMDDIMEEYEALSSSVAHK